MADKSMDINYNQQLDISPAHLVEMKQVIIQEKPIIILQPSGHIYYTNDAFLEMVHTSSQNIYTRHFFDFLHREDAQPVLDIIVSLMSSSVSQSAEYSLQIKSTGGTYIRKQARIKIVKQQSRVLGIKIEFVDE